MKLTTTYRRTGNTISPFAAFEDEVNRVLGVPFGTLGGGLAPSATVPAADIREDANALSVALEIPGVRPEDVRVSFHEGVLTISGERKAPGDASGYHLRERPTGRFERSFGIRVAVDANAVTGVCKDGVLTVTLPKTPEARPRQVQITAA